MLKTMHILMGQDGSHIRSFHQRILQLNIEIDLTLNNNIIEMYKSQWNEK